MGQRQGALVISEKCYRKGYVCSSVSALNKDTGWNTKVCVSMKQVPFSFTLAPTSFTWLRRMAPSSLRGGRRKSFHLKMDWLKNLSGPWKTVSFLSLRVWIHSSPFPAATGLLWEPQASSVENNQKFKIPGATEKITEVKVLEKTPTWVSVPLKITELVTNRALFQPAALPTRPPTQGCWPLESHISGSTGMHLCNWPGEYS